MSIVTNSSVSLLNYQQKLFIILLSSPCICIWLSKTHLSPLSPLPEPLQGVLTSPHITLIIITRYEPYEGVVHNNKPVPKLTGVLSMFCNKCTHLVSFEDIVRYMFVIQYPQCCNNKRPCL